MGDFVSYSNYQPTNEPASSTFQSEPHFERNTTSITIRNGEAVSENKGNVHVSSSDLSPYGHDDWRSTARNARTGSRTAEVDDESIVTIGGVSGKVRDFVNAGAIPRDWQTAPAQSQAAPKVAPQAAPKDAPQEETQARAESVSHPAEVAEVLQASVADIPQHAYDNAMASGMHVAATGGDMASIAESLSRNTGMAPSKAAEVVQFHANAYQSQADAYLTKHAGLAAEDLQGFYAFCQERSNKSALSAAIQSQVHASSMVGYKALVDRFLSNSAPGEAALNARGFETKDGTHGPMVRIQGQWMSVKVAAKTGLI